MPVREMPGEAALLLGPATRHPFVRGDVGWLDLFAPGIEVAAESAAAAHNLVLKRCRMLVHGHPDPDFGDFDAQRRGFACLVCHGLAYDLLLKPASLPSASRLAAFLPKQVFVLDHLTKPDFAGDLPGWCDGLARLAMHPNMLCKLPSLVTQAPLGQAFATNYVALLDVRLERFGPERLMIASDWPVSRLAARYGRQ